MNDPVVPTSHPDKVLDIVRSRAINTATLHPSTRDPFPVVVQGIPYDDVTRVTDALTRSGYRCRAMHDLGAVHVAGLKQGGGSRA